MEGDYQKNIFRRNLLRYLGDTPQAEVAKAIDVSPQTFNTWCQGKAIPRIKKTQALADYFNINISDLIEDKPPSDDKALEEFIKYYNSANPELRKAALAVLKSAAPPASGNQKPADTE